VATNPSPPAIAATGLRKSFGEHVVLDGVDLNVAEGTIFSLLGPNGAGKTTTVQVLSTLIGADGGEVRIAGHDLATDPDLVRAAIGVTGQFSAVDGLLTGQENLILMADLHHLDNGSLSPGSASSAAAHSAIPVSEWASAASLSPAWKCRALAAALSSTADVSTWSSLSARR
jgi:ABC-type multidrug transport system ATPase subunit